MSNKRGADQKMLMFPAKVAFIDGLDKSLPQCGYSNRSQFMRDAIAEKLRKNGINVPQEIVMPGGRYPAPKGGGFELNEKPPGKPKK